MYEGATLSWVNFAVPILTMIVVGLAAMFWRGPEGLFVDSGLNIGGVRLGLAATAALLVAFVMYRLRGDVPSNDDGVEARITEMKGIFLAAVILTFASTSQNAVTTLGISAFVTNWFGGLPAGIVRCSSS